jgi:hypothetical protein
LGGKIARYISQVENDVPGAKLELTGHEETEKPEPKPGQSKSKPVKPPRNRRPVGRARKTEPANASNPLNVNETEAAQEENPSQEQSKSVKVDQTAIPPANGVGLAAEDSVPISPVGFISPISSIVPPDPADSWAKDQKSATSAIDMAANGVILELHH